MYTDYKIKRITNDGINTTVDYAIYEGDYVSVIVPSKTGSGTETATIYQRSARLKTGEVLFAGAATLKKTQDTLNLELKNDKTRTAIDQQKTAVV